MTSPRRHHLSAEQGFTLIELLVVILIVGILAAVAVPAFLGQRNKASDVNVESAISTAHLTEANYRVTNGQYAQSTSLSSNTAAASALSTMEASLTSPIATYNMQFSQYPTGASGSATSGYQIQGTATDGVTYSLQYLATSGTVVKTCLPVSTGSCNASGNWG